MRGSSEMESWRFQAGTDNLNAQRLCELTEGAEAVSTAGREPEDFRAVSTLAPSVVMRASYFRVQSSLWIPKAKGISSMHWIFSKPQILWGPLGSVLECCKFPIWKGFSERRPWMPGAAKCHQRNIYLSCVSLIIEALSIHTFVLKTKLCTHGLVLENEVFHLWRSRVETKQPVEGVWGAPAHSWHEYLFPLIGGPNCVLKWASHAALYLRWGQTEQSRQKMFRRLISWTCVMDIAHDRVLR